MRDTLRESVRTLSHEEILGLASAATLAYTDTLAALHFEVKRLEFEAAVCDYPTNGKPLEAAAHRERQDKLQEAIALMVRAIGEGIV